ncbi:MAG: DUF2065 domain-containing protein [Pseudomonadales bacterium]
MWHDLIVVLCVVLVVEGVLPFLSPRSWRRMAYYIAQLDDRSMRIMGLVSMLLGAGVLYSVNG